MTSYIGWSGLTMGLWGWGCSLGYDFSRDGSTLTVRLTACELFVNCWAFSAARSVSGRVWTSGDTFQDFTISWSDVSGGAEEGRYEYFDRAGVTLTFDVGHSSGSFSITDQYGADAPYGVISGTTYDGTVRPPSGKVTVPFGATGQMPDVPSITDIESTPDGKAVVYYDPGQHGDPATYPVRESNLDSVDATRPDVTGSTNDWGGDGIPTTSSPVTSGVIPAASIRSFRISQLPDVNPAWRFSKTAVVVTPPSRVKTVNAEASGYLGVRLTWALADDAGSHDAYRTHVYDGDPRSGGREIGSVAAGVTEITVNDAYAGSGFTEKTFYVRQEASYDAWTRPEKSSFASSGIAVDYGANEPVGASLSNGAAPPSPAYNAKADYSVSNGVIDDKKAVVTWEAAGSSSSNVRTGWSVYQGDKEILSFDSTIGGSFSRVVSCDISDAAVSFTVVAHGPGGDSSATTNYLYGNLSAPRVTSFNRTSDVLSLSFEVGARYPVSTHIACTSDAGSHTVTVPGNGARMVTFRWPEAIASNVKATLEVRPSSLDDGQPRSFGSTSVEVGPSTGPVTDLSAKQDSDEPDGMPRCVVTWSPPMFAGVETADSYLVTCGDAGISQTVPASGDATYSFSFPWNVEKTIEISVEAKRGTFSCGVRSTQFRYNPDTLTVPVISGGEASESGSGMTFDIHVTKRPDGSAIDNDGRRGYVYQVYADSQRLGDPFFESDASFDTQVTIRSPKPTLIRMTARDATRESDLSNGLTLAYDAQGVGLFAYDAGDITIEDCLIERVPQCVRVMGDTTMAMRGVTMAPLKRLAPSVSESTHYYMLEAPARLIEFDMEWLEAK